MASQWLRIATTAAIISASGGVLLPGHAQAATAAAAKAAPCKTATSATKASASCPAKVHHAKKPAAKAAAVKTSIQKTPPRAHKPASPEALLKSISASGPKGDIASLRSTTAYVQDVSTSNVLFAKNENVVRPIASISKLMTAMVVVDANQPLDETLEISEDDIDTLRHSGSRLPVGTRLSRGDMLHLALMSSENRAAHALGRYYPGGMPAFVAAMNAKARELGMSDTHFIEPTGLSSENVSSPRDLARMVIAASKRPLIHRFTTDGEYEVDIKSRAQTFRNTNMLVRRPDWDIKISKTGFIREAGECLVMMTHIDGRDLAIVLLDSQGSLSRIGDAVRIRRILQSELAML